MRHETATVSSTAGRIQCSWPNSRLLAPFSCLVVNCLHRINSPRRRQPKKIPFALTHIFARGGNGLFVYSARYISASLHRFKDIENSLPAGLRSSLATPYLPFSFHLSALHRKPYDVPLTLNRTSLGLTAEAVVILVAFSSLISNPAFQDLQDRNNTR